MEALFISLFIAILIFIYGSTVGWAIHALLHTKRFKKLFNDHNLHHTLYTPSDFESEGVYRDAGSARSTLVFIPIITSAIVILCIPLWFIFHTWWIYPIVLTVGVGVGWLNDWVHEAIHLKNHWMNRFSFFRKLKALHYIHHLTPNHNHGIVWFGADRLFGTYKE